MEHKMYPVFVDNISNEVKTADLRSVFTRYGDVVEVTIVSNHGFVIYGNPNEDLAFQGVQNRYYGGEAKMDQKLRQS